MAKKTNKKQNKTVTARYSENDKWLVIPNPHSSENKVRSIIAKVRNSEGSMIRKWCKVYILPKVR